MRIKIEKAYWFIPLFIFAFQAIYTFASMHQIRLEEVVETFRSTWWFKNRLVADGTYAFLGWYTILNAFYSLFGIGVYTPKFAKLFFELISFFCLASVLKDYFGVKKAWLPLLVIGLSPSFMYFNSLNLSMGLEVSFFFICLYLMRFKIPFFWSVAMFAWLTYFGFIFFIPILAGFYFVMVGKIRPTGRLKNIVMSAIFFLIPLIILFFYISNRQYLVRDPMSGKGLFRSYGSFELSGDVWMDNFKRISADLFSGPKSYHFEQKKVEFSDYYPIISLAAVIVLSYLSAFKVRGQKRLIVLIFALLIFYFLLINFMGPKTVGGLRRATVLLVVFYALYSLLWWNLDKIKGLSHNVRIAITCAFLILLVHHLIVFPLNVSAVSKTSPLVEKWWFEAQNPEKTLDELVFEASRADVVLPCIGYFDEETTQCRGLSLIYPAIAGGCYWRNLICHKVYVSDTRTGKLIELKLDYWMVNRPKSEP